MREERPQQTPGRDRLEAILERALHAYHRGELHGGAKCVVERELDGLLVPITREAFQDADELPDDEDVLRVLDSEKMQLLGEGYHVIALVEPRRRFVVKYAKHLKPVPPLASPAPASREEWERDYGVRPDGSLHPAIWQHIRAFEAYGPLAVPSRVYIADGVLASMSADEREALQRFRSIGIVRSLGNAPRGIRVAYADDFPQEKRASDRLNVSAIIVQPLVTQLAAAIERALRAGDAAVARDLEARYEAFTEQLWRCGISHLDFSILNIGLIGSGPSERLQIFDPHIGVIEDGESRRSVRDPLESNERSIDSILRSSRDGSRWALWRVQQDVSASSDVPAEGAHAASAMVQDFHVQSEGLEEGGGSFGFKRFDRTWQQGRTRAVNTVMHAQLWALTRHPLTELVRSILDADLVAPDTVYDRKLPVMGMSGERPLAQFRAGLKVYDSRPLLLIANLAEQTSSLMKHWGRVRLPPELDVQDDPAIHYHLRDLFTGELYVFRGDDLAHQGFVVGLAPRELHVLQVEDVRVAELAVERSLAAHRDISAFLRDCTKRVGVVGDVHGEMDALKDVLRALGFIDSLDSWSARDGTLVFTGDIGHGRHLQQVFDFIHTLAGQAHTLGGRIVWTLGNHDLYADREGGQGGEDSLGYRLWPTIREAALHPERHPGLTVQAAYFEFGKLFVHGGVLPNIIEVAKRERRTEDPYTIASYVNDVLRRTLVERERINATDLPHEIFRIGTSHTRERRMPGEIGYEPAGVFTPDLRELDHYRYAGKLLPQVVGHTASQRGEIRYSPGSWLGRDYIAVDVGRQHGSGNGGLLLTDFGWVAVTPGGPARLVEVTPLFVRLASQAAAGEASRDVHGEAHLKRMLRTYFSVAKATSGTSRQMEEALVADLAPAQVVALERFLTRIRETRRCVVITDLDAVLTAFSGGSRNEDTIEVIADYLRAGGILVFTAASTFEWFYTRLLRTLVVKLGPRSPLLAGVMLMISGGKEIFAFDDGAYRLTRVATAGADSGGFDAAAALAKEEHRAALPAFEPATTAYIADSSGPKRFDQTIASRVGIVINVGDGTPASANEPINSLHHGYHRAIGVILAATEALRESGPRADPPSQPDPGDTVPWTFERPHFPPGGRLRILVGGNGFVHAGVRHRDGVWNPVYNVPLVPLPQGGYEAVLPSDVNVFTFFWTEAPWTPGRPGHWERDRDGPRVFTAGAV